jgi:PAS domain S-box-containing protein
MSALKPDSVQSLEGVPREAVLARDREAFERMLAEREDFYRSVIESLSEGVLITNVESRIIYVNSVLEKISGYSRDEMVGQISHKFLAPPELWPLMEKRLGERLLGKTETYEHQMICKDGSRHWVHVRATPYRNCRGEILGTVGAISCIERQKALEFQNEYLTQELREEFGHIIGSSPALKQVLQQVESVAPTDANVLILGESGTGKELVARCIHDLSARKRNPLIRVNCAAVPKELFESEFFGHVRGAYTGAIKDRVGRFELAEGGTLFLDEVGEIPIDLQSKLLRVLQEGQFERLGEDRTRKVNVRVVAATNRDLLNEAKAGRFRLDLYYRLAVFPISVPPLRERREDIPALAEHFLEQASARLNVRRPSLTAAQMASLQAYAWPGNIRELQNVIERAVILSRVGPLRIDLPDNPAAPESTPGGDSSNGWSALQQRERDAILHALQKTQWKIYGADGAAALLNVKPTTLTSKIKRFRIERTG